MTERDGFHLTGEATPLGQLVGDLVRARPLLTILARKDFFVRYRRASFGLLWAAVLPLFQAVVLAVVLSHVVRIHTGVNYALFVFSGTVVWSFFSGAVSGGATAIVDGADLSTKVYFPRAVLPLVTVLSSGYGYAIGLVVLVVMALATGTGLGWSVVLLPVALALTALVAAAFALVLAALHVYFRDVRYIVQAALLAWFYVTPVFYPLSAAKGLAPWISANPATGPVELVRVATFGGDHGWGGSVAWSLAWSAALLVAAALLHRRYNRVFVDLL